MRLQWAMRARQYATLTLQARISMSSRTRRAAAAIRCTDIHLLLTGNDLNGLFQIIQIGAQPAAHIIIIDLLALDGGGAGCAVDLLCVLDDANSRHQEIFT